MKTFKQLREECSILESKKHDGVPYNIKQVDKGFEVTIDGDVLDVFKSKKIAMDTVKMVISTLKK